MKRYICDVCGKEFGYNVSYSLVTTTYKQADFIDDGFIFKKKDDADICSNCYNRIAEAQNREIKQIKQLKED